MKLQFTAKASSILGLLLTRSAQASFYVCTQENFVGLCQEYSLPYNDCRKFLFPHPDSSRNLLFPLQVDNRSLTSTNEPLTDDFESGFFRKVVSAGPDPKS